MRQVKHSKVVHRAKQKPREFKREEESEAFLVLSLIVLGIVVAILLIITFVRFESVKTLEIGDSPVLGSANAPITLYEFLDFSCPYSSAVEGKNPEIESYLKSMTPGWQAPMPLVKSQYVDSGQVKIVFKYVSGTGAAHAAHLVGWCLNEQGLFWQFKDLAYANQLDVGNLDKMKSLALSLGASSTKLDSCLESKKYDSYFERDSSVAYAYGVRESPGFIINGKVISGAQSFSVFNQIIDAELSK